MTASGCEIIERCPALTSVMWAWARFAMNSWIDDGIALSIVPTRSQLGIVFHAGGPDGAVTALRVTGACVAARTAPSFECDGVFQRVAAVTPTALAAFAIRSATSFGCETIGTWLEGISTVFAPCVARRRMCRF